MTIKLISERFKGLSFIILILLIILPLNYTSRANLYSKNIYLNNLQLSANSSNIDLSRLPEIDTNIWYEPKIEMLVITPDNEDYINAVTPLVDWKNEKGLKTLILSNFSDYPGRDDAERIRNMIKSYYTQENIKYVLLAGDAEEDIIPIRQVYNPDVIDRGQGDSEYLNWDDYYKPTDFYYADLTGSWDDDNDNNFGESEKYNANHVDEISWIPEVYVGRLPASSALELERMINKTLKYEKDPYIGKWMNRMLLGAAILEDGIYKEDEARLTEYIWKNFVLSEMNFTHLYKATSSFIPDIPPSPSNQTELNSNNFDTEFDSGYSTVLLTGHADPTRFTSLYVGTIYDNYDANSCENMNMPALFYGDACTTSSYDKNDDSIGELLIKKENTGAVGYIGGLRVTWYANNDTNLKYLNRANTKLFWSTFFNESMYQQGKALYESKIAYINSDIFISGGSSMYFEWHRKNVLSYCLLGDPTLDIYTDEPKKAMNPFDAIYLEGQQFNTVIKNFNNETIPYARVHLKSNDGKYRTFYADKNGLVSIRLPPQENETFYVTITGHNLITSNFNFSTMIDNSAPQIIDVDWSPKKPTTLDNINFNISTYDNQSGIESVFILLTKNNFEDFTYYRIENNNPQDLINFEYEINKLDPEDYRFAVYIRNYANNTDFLYELDFKFTIPIPIVDYILVLMLIMSLSVIGISIIFVFKGLKKR